MGKPVPDKIDSNCLKLRTPQAEGAIGEGQENIKYRDTKDKLLKRFLRVSKVNRLCSNKKRTNLLALPPELLLKIFSYLHPINAACLGVTCHTLYLIYWALHPKTSLEARTVKGCHARWTAPWSSRRKCILAGLLADWMKPLIFTYEPHPVRRTSCKEGSSKFMTKERHNRLLAEGKNRVRFMI